MAPKSNYNAVKISTTKYDKFKLHPPNQTRKQSKKLSKASSYKYLHFNCRLGIVPDLGNENTLEFDMILD